MALAATQSSPSFTVEWSGTDAGSGIATYTIFVSENGGPYTPFVSDTADTSATFNGQAGKTYAFYSIARDLVGHEEAPPAAADAVTTIGGLDQCPNDPNKTEPGACGCSVPDTDSDSDGAADCNDQCPADANKQVPGVCGCGVADTDSDGDGTADCQDGCPADPTKTQPGVCGCGQAETVGCGDRDGDGTPDSSDGCPDDGNKTVPGVCGCGVADTDSDGDGILNCNDGCVNDPTKTAPGVCGCGVLETDTDGDGTPDCLDACPTDPVKTQPGVCGCGVLETDTDGDGTQDCLDACPDDPQNDVDGDRVCGNVDNCPTIANPDQADTDGDGIGDVCEEIGFQFSGFFPPVDNPPALNAVKAGRAIPVKFSLNGDQGLNIFEVGYPKSQVIACDSTNSQDGIEETVTAGFSSLSYDASTDQYSYVWKTDKAWAGTCRQFIVQLNDGSVHTAKFKFTK